jgi:hypothetical protein
MIISHYQNKKLNTKLVEPYYYMHGSNPDEPSHLSIFPIRLAIIKNIGHKISVKNGSQTSGPVTYLSPFAVYSNFKEFVN